LPALSGAFGCIAFDNSKLVAALPSLSARYHVGPALIGMITEANIFVYASLLLVGGALGDHFGPRRMLLVGLGVFGVAALAGALVGSPHFLLLARAFVGAGAACITPATLAVIKQTFPERDRPRAVAIWTSCFGIGATLGPIVGGALLGQRDISLALASTCLPVALCFWGSVRCVPRPLPDRISAQPPWHLLARRFSSVIPSDDPRFRRVLLVIALAYFAFSGASFVIPQYLQLGRFTSAFESGLRAAPLAASLLFGTLFSSRLITRWGVERALSANLTLAGSGALLVALACSSQSGLAISLALVPFGFGSGGTFASGTELILASVTADRAAGAGALGECVLEFGGVLGVAVLGSVASATADPRAVLLGGPRALAVAALVLLGARVVLAPRARQKPAPV
jgi:MFS family permease